ncbi:hypothetical protein MG290_10645 [Flavobacterium sp. CBA20B-1]|uniref:hypothetical protein n=1 Tax=unclassified Flavobacterium TaxID=196869 RepID=UPI00222451BA|nr:MULTISPECIES: hypothetical protein [unclassified Flavobacterium]WCM41415.1 hypothetical protein MG290_10645 [Flavobacterium sp. CBA20B-1]
MKKVFSLLLICLPLTFLAVSCHEEEDPIVKTTPYSKYKGPWSGTYSGGDSGIIEFSVKDDGSIIGTIESDNFPESDMSLKGKVTIEGEINIRILYLNEIDWGGFVGTITETSGSGTWINTSAGNITGTWVAGK